MTFTAKAILFDMDGVLIDSAPAVERVWRKWAVGHHLDPGLVVAQAHGRRSIETIRAVAPQMDAARENIQVEQMEIEDKEGVIALPGALHLLHCLPQARFAVVTSATRPLAEARLGYAGLPLPRKMVTADDVVQGKPSPEPYLKGAALLGVAAADCVVFEDTPAGIVSAHAAGMRAVALGNTYPIDQLKAADAFLPSLNEVHFQLRGESMLLHLNSMTLKKTGEV